MRVAIYIRVSTLDQAREGYSLAAQRAALEHWATDRRHEIVRVYVVQLAQLFGFDVSALASEWQQALVGVVTAVFGVLTVAGIIVDPTTEEMSDSNQALGYTEPKTTGK